VTERPREKAFLGGFRVKQGSSAASSPPASRAAGRNVRLDYHRPKPSQIIFTAQLSA
jgi:hypothetical protein